MSPGAIPYGRPKARAHFNLIISIREREITKLLSLLLLLLLLSAPKKPVKAGSGLVKGRVLVPVPMDWAMVAAFLVVCNCLLTVWLAAKAALLLQLGLEDLDGRLAEAIRSVLESAGGDFEPVNPVQAAVAQFITERMSQAPIQAVVTETRTRSKDGKFE